MITVMGAVNRYFVTMCMALAIAMGSHAADGNELVAIGAIQKGTGGAGVAAPKDATWSLLNPAAMVDLEPRVDLSFETFLNHIEADAGGLQLLSNPDAKNLTDYNAIPIPSISAVWRPNDDDAFGIGILGIEGNRVEFRKSRATLAIFQHEDRRSALEVAKIPISYAHRFDNGWTIGGSILADYTRFRTDSLTLRLRPTEGDYEWDIGFGIGFQLAVYRNWENFAVGATYTSRQAMQQYEKYDDLVLWNLDFPSKLQAGFAWRPLPRLELVVDYKWINWSEIKQLSEPTIRGGAGWIDQHIVKAGVTWDPEGPWTFRAGTSFGKPPVPDHAVFVNLITPAIANLHFGGGFSYVLSDKSEIHFSYIRALENDAEENGQGDLFSRLGKGSSVSYSEDSFTLQYTWKF
jgi:long-chain fatty acid transport protein